MRYNTHLLLALISSSVLAMGYPELQLPKSPAPVLDPSTGRLQSVPAIMNYVDGSKTTTVHLRRDTTGVDAELQAHWLSQEVQVRNGRDSKPTLHKQGFELINNPMDGKAVDFLDNNDVIDNYYPRCQELLQKALGGNVKVQAFDHNIRKAGNNDEDIKSGDGSKVLTPLGVVHGDYTKVSAPRRLLDLGKPPKSNDVWRQRLEAGASLIDPVMAEKAAAGEKRFAFVNVWRSIDPNSPVKSFPLACADATTVNQKDLRTLQLHYVDRIGENYLAEPSDRHGWTYFPEMSMDEAMLIKQWDSLGDLGAGKKEADTDCSTFALHTAFATATEPGVPPRQSIEVRCVCVWE